MKISLFYHSLISDWNHGNAHFLRGICKELLKAGHQLRVMEPKDNWSLTNLVEEKGRAVYKSFESAFPTLRSEFYDPGLTAIETFVNDADLVIVHEWNAHNLVKKIGELKKRFGYRLLFHDTHHRAVTDPESVAAYDLEQYDGVLAFGNVIKEIYLKRKWAKKAWTWHEAADTDLFKPLEKQVKTGDLVWVGNWGDDERTHELMEFLIKPVRELGLKATIYGVRYPDIALSLLRQAGITYGGYLPSHKVPEIFAQYHFTVHVPRGPYTSRLSGIPTIRPFEAMACGIPLISAPWRDSENLFRAEEDFLMVRNTAEMKEAMANLLENEDKRRRLLASGLQTVLQKHTCRHRVEELIDIYHSLMP